MTALPFGMRVVESPYLPIYPTPGTDGRRIVRHGLAAHWTNFEEWAGPVGPKPGETTDALIIGGDTVLASASIVGALRGLS